MRIITIVGARPQFIKCGPLSRFLRRDNTEILVHTGQHYDPLMSDLFFRDLALPQPDYNLGVGSESHGVQTGEMLRRIEEVCLAENPNLVLVFGDTNSTLAGALAAAKLHIPVGHIEAGLRSFDRRMPEEVNRVLTDHCSDLLFAPTKTAIKNLVHEGITRGVYCTGDVMVDALQEHIAVAKRKSLILEELAVEPGSYSLATVHRAENTDDQFRLKSIMGALMEIGDVIFPCHPRTEKILKQFGIWEKAKNMINIIPPVGYPDMLVLEANSARILTDSGGVQKEAYILGKTCITLRNSTEWIETVAEGWNVLADADKDLIIDAVRKAAPSEERKNLFGDGRAAEHIADIIKSLEPDIKRII